MEQGTGLIENNYYKQETAIPSITSKIESKINFGIEF